MKRTKFSVCIITILAMLLCSLNVFAASGSSSISVSSSSLEVGDTLTVTVSVSAPDNIFGLEGALSYNSSVLEFISGDSAGGGGGTVSIINVADSEDQDSMSFTLSFEAISHGSSGLSFSALSTYTSDLEEFSTSGCSTNITVKKSSAPVVDDSPEYEEDYTPEENTEKPEEDEKKPEEEIFATIGGVKYKIWQDYEGVELPDGFGPYIFEYNNLQSMGAVDGSGRIRIAYLENTETNEKGFYIYTNEQFIPYVSVKAVATPYVLYPLEEGVKVPAVFDIEEKNFRGGSLPVWRSSDERLEGFVLMYATSAGGERCFYLYEERTATVTRFIQMNFEDPVIEEVPADPEPMDKAQSLYAKIIEDKEIFTIIAVLAAFAVSLLIACIFLFSVRRSKRVNKEKFQKKMEKKKAKFDKRNQKLNSSNPPEASEITIETENFDEMVESATENAVQEPENTEV